MNDTRQTIEKILSEIESRNVECIPQSGKSITQIMDILLERTQGNSADNANQAGEPFDMAELAKWRERNNQIWHVSTDHELGSTKPIIGKLDIFVKKLVRKLIRPTIYSIVAEQNDFNASVTSSINALYNTTVVTKALLAEQKSQIESLRNEINALRDENDSLRDMKENDVYSVIDYDKFEGHFRGSKEVIKEAQMQYIPYFEGKNNVVDLGCGRGEFLELLKEHNINAVGVDMYADFVEECKQKNLNVVLADALGYITGVGNESLDGIFAAQLAEHLKTADLAMLCKQAYRKLKFGGCFILETPNPTCLSTYTNAFYIDPTHVKPVHPKMLEYFLRDAGFTTVEIVYTDSSRVNYRLPLLDIAGVNNLAEINDSINLLTDLIFGSQDYAIIAKK